MTACVHHRKVDPRDVGLSAYYWKVGEKVDHCYLYDKLLDPEEDCLKCKYPRSRLEEVIS